MDYEQIFDQSFERCRQRTVSKPFFEYFYERFIARDPRVAEIFHNTPLQHQHKMLEKSFYRLVLFYSTNSADDYIEDIAIKHDRNHHNIDPDLYELWLDTLMEAVKKYDPRFSDRIELAWRLVLSTGITYMKFKYDH
ncbi:MAG: globin [Motiliproteus sp.]